MGLLTCRQCKGPLVEVPGHPPGIHPMCAEETGDWEKDSWHLASDWAVMVDQGIAKARMAGATAFIVAGGRGYVDAEQFRAALRPINRRALMRHGGARGADTALATLWAQMGGDTEAYPADFRAPCVAECPPRQHRAQFEDGSGDYCPLHGPRRNRAMAAAGGDFLLQFPGGDGTADMAAAVGAVGIPVRIVPELLRRPEKRGFAKSVTPRRAA